MIVVIDYGLGNLRSVSKALEAIGCNVEVTNDARKIGQANALVLPGVGAFKRGMENLRRLNLVSFILEAVSKGKPILGICLGLQLLFTESQEHGLSEGLDIIKGRVKKFPAGVKLPHMGWNTIKTSYSGSLKVEDSSIRNIRMFDDIPNGAYFYFLHSYFVEPEDKEVISATTEYGREFVCAIQKDNIWGVQFHPEKSSAIGLRFLKNFCNYAC